MPPFPLDPLPRPRMSCGIGCWTGCWNNWSLSWLHPSGSLVFEVMRPRKNCDGLFPTVEARSKVFAVSDRVLIRASNPSPNRFLPASGNSSDAKDDSAPFSIDLLQHRWSSVLRQQCACMLKHYPIAFSFICSQTYFLCLLPWPHGPG